ncbi:MAG: chemotaxis protein CheA, partial [Acidobacteria bacterium]|nr:chemotaxis protein CheA [Acidobacteriota bacterium]
QTDEQLYQLLFRPGFTTRQGADLSAGRGIGLGAVAQAVISYGGRVDVSSVPGSGSRFLLRLPLSVSITRALLVEVEREEYALPLGAVVESLRFRLEELE